MSLRFIHILIRSRLQRSVDRVGSVDEAVESGLDFNSVEFDGIKIRVVKRFPDSRELDAVALSLASRLLRLRSVWSREWGAKFRR